MINFDPIDFDRATRLMTFLESLRTEKTLDEILITHSFQMVYEMTKMIAFEGRISNNMIKDGSMVKKHAAAIYSEIQTKFPIETFPEKYI